MPKNAGRGDPARVFRVWILGLPAIHPGEQLRAEFLEPPGIAAYRLAKDLKAPATRVQAIVAERRGTRVTPRCDRVVISARHRGSGGISNATMSL